MSEKLKIHVYPTDEKAEEFLRRWKDPDCVGNIYTESPLEGEKGITVVFTIYGEEEGIEKGGI